MSEYNDKKYILESSEASTKIILFYDYTVAFLDKEKKHSIYINEALELKAKTGRRKYYCSCGSPENPVVKIPVKRGVDGTREHFRHYDGNEYSTTCNYNHDTHKLAIEILQIHVNHDKKPIHLPPCYEVFEDKTYCSVEANDVLFNSISTSKRYKTSLGELIPDAVLTTKDGYELAIEIHVTHKKKRKDIEKYIELGLDAIEITIPKNSNVESIENIITKNYAGKKWLYNEQRLDNTGDWRETTLAREDSKYFKTTHGLCVEHHQSAILRLIEEIERKFKEKESRSEFDEQRERIEKLHQQESMAKEELCPFFEKQKKYNTTIKELNILLAGEERDATYVDGKIRKLREEIESRREEIESRRERIESNRNFINDTIRTIKTSQRESDNLKSRQNELDRTVTENNLDRYDEFNERRKQIESTMETINELQAVVNDTKQAIKQTRKRINEFTERTRRHITHSTDKRVIERRERVKAKRKRINLLTERIANLPNRAVS